MQLSNGFGEAKAPQDSHIRIARQLNTLWLSVGQMEKPPSKFALIHVHHPVDIAQSSHDTWSPEIPSSDVSAFSSRVPVGFRNKCEILEIAATTNTEDAAWQAGGV
ncbi:hypothetical protein [Pseudomonas savastanoi]|uniref:hypothetical protein n=1 Tax=Pseudomonas savastanoi TaxID=29438 RepID=UPI0013C2BBA2|nr:hypothetical protein [Pseudomonas savastanoi]